MNIPLKKSLISISLLLLFAWGCQLDNFDEVSNQQQQQPEPVITRVYKGIPSARLSGEGLCGDVITNPLYGLNQKCRIGYLSIGNNADSLYVNFDLEDGWYMFATYLYVGPAEDVPVSHWGLPKVGEFPYKDYLGKEVKDHTVAVPLADLGPSTSVAAFVIAYRWENHWGHHYRRFQGLWGHGNRRIGRTWGWGWTVDYTIQECDNGGGGTTPSCSLAWAEGSNSYTINSSQLGWYGTYVSSGSNYVRTLYANSGPNNITDGIPVGTVYISYFGVGGTYDLTVTYILSDPAYRLTETNLYVGSAAPDMDPGLFPYNATDLSTNVYEFTFNVSYQGSTAPTLYISAEGITCTN